MTITDFSAAPAGSRFLISCDSNSLEIMVEAIGEMATSAYKERAALNTSVIATMDMKPDENPNRFSDLLSLCAKLVTVAGRRSHFEGLLLLNISALITSPANTTRLKALGELLSINKGLASKCVTVIYGPTTECDLLICADLLDFDGKLKVGCYDLLPEHQLPELLARESLHCATPIAEKLLMNTITNMKAYKNFNISRFIKTCGNTQGIITTCAISDVLSNPYSYVNRIKRSSEIQSQSSERKIGFQVSR